jgi:hypothetical protein
VFLCIDEDLYYQQDVEKSFELSFIEKILFEEQKGFRTIKNRAKKMKTEQNNRESSSSVS